MDLHMVLNTNNYWVQTQTVSRYITQNKLKGIEQDAEEMLESDESIVLQYATLKDEVKQQRETIEQMKADYDELYEKHTKRERFYAKYGFID